MHWPDVFNGIQLCIGFQLLLIAIFLLKSRQKRNYLLGFYTILISVSSLTSGLYTYLEGAPLINFLFGAHLIIFHSPLLFLYIKSLGDTHYPVRNHFVFPLLYTMFYIAVKLFFTEFFEAHNLPLLVAHLFISVVYTGIYFYFGSKYFDIKLSDSLKQKALRKFRLFYVITNIHAICLYSLMAISYVTYLYFYEDFLFFNEHIVPDIFSFIIYIHPLTSIIFIVYLLSETHSLHSLILDKGIKRNFTIGTNKHQITSKIRALIDVEKKFKNPQYNLKLLSKDIGVSTKELTEFFSEELSTSFVDYIHKKKIAEFKLLMREDVENTYSLEGLARLAGFKSKATFYRVFKKEEGVTPTQYKDHQKHSALPQN